MNMQEEIILTATMENTCAYCGKKINWRFQDCYVNFFKGLVGLECPHCKNKHYVNISLEEIPFEVDSTGYYKTRAGKKAYVYKIYGDRIDFTIDGGKRKYIGHNKKGNFFDNNARHSKDIISKWEENKNDR